MKKVFLLIFTILVLSGCSNDHFQKIETDSTIYSLDGKYIAYTKDAENVEYDPVDPFNYNEIWLRNLDLGNEYILVKSGDIKNLNITNVNQDNYPFSEIRNLSIVDFSTDSNYLYFFSKAWTTSLAVFSVNIKTGEIFFITDSNYLEVIKEGKYKDMLITNHHRYYNDREGSYDHYYITNPTTGEDIKEIGEEKYGNDLAEGISEIRLPINYFSEKNIRHGSSDGKDGWERASLDEMTYQSYPTTSITLPNNTYSIDIRDLGNTKSLEEIIKENNTCGENKNEDCGYLDQIKDNYEKYKELAQYYLPNWIIFLEKFDVDGDGSSETIVYGCGVGGNHCPHTVDIIKNNQIIFSVDGVNIADITPVETGNGFYLDWHNDKDLEGGYCCPFGYVRTKFVYENNRFIPVLEQKVDYLRIVDSLSYNDVSNSKMIDSQKHDYYKSHYEGKMVEWTGKISSYYSQITGIKFCIIDDEHQNVDINQPCDMFWAFADELMGADNIATNPDWDGNWVSYILNYYKVSFDKNSDYFNDIYTVKGIVNGIDCAPSDKCSPDIEIISIRK